MSKLFSNSDNSKVEDPSFGEVYNELIKNTLELWFKLQGGTTTLDSVVSAFEQAQCELSKKGEFVTGIKIIELENEQSN
jgi:hypothetical protein